MSNRQLGWDDQRIRDRLDPREIVEGEKEQLTQEKPADEMQPNDDQWIPPGNPDQGSRKK